MFDILVFPCITQAEYKKPYTNYQVYYMYVKCTHIGIQLSRNLKVINCAKLLLQSPQEKCYRDKVEEAYV
jgi:hypothetical protein